MMHRTARRLSAGTAVFALMLGACERVQPEPPLTPLAIEGRAMAQELCAPCHAISTADESPHPDAPALRTLAENYAVRDLEEAFAEGIVVGHPDMPMFQFEPDEIDALLAYLERIQVPRAT